MGDPVIAAIMDGHYQHTVASDRNYGKCYADGEKWECPTIRKAKEERGPMRFAGKPSTDANPFRRE